MKLEQSDKDLHEILKAHKIAKCPECGRKLDRADCSWNSASTEAGTDYSILNIICENCSTKVVHLMSWNPFIRSFEGFVNELDSELDYKATWKRGFVD